MNSTRRIYSKYDMIPFLRRKGALRAGQSHTDLPKVSQPMPLPDPPSSDPADGMSVTELSELEARTLCAREDIAVFWPRPGKDKRVG